MRPREAALPQLERGLRLHPRKRLVLLEELRADLDALEDELTARGLPRSRARAAAAMRLLPDPQAARALEHEAALYHRLARGRGGTVLQKAERVAIGLVAALVAVALAVAMAGLELTGSAALFALAMITLISLIVANTLRVAWGLWVRQDLRAADRRAAWRVQLGLILVGISIGGLGAVVLAYGATGRLVSSADVSTAFTLVRDVALLASLGLGAAVIGLLGWLALTPSLRSYDLFERRIAAVFVPPGPRLVRSHDTQETPS
jgi:hypothetical protein